LYALIQVTFVKVNYVKIINFYITDLVKVFTVW